MQVDQHTGVLRPAIGSLLCCRCWACSFTPGLNIVFCLCTYNRARYVLNAISAHVFTYTTASMTLLGLESQHGPSSLGLTSWQPCNVCKTKGYSTCFSGEEGTLPAASGPGRNLPRC